MCAIIYMTIYSMLNVDILEFTHFTLCLCGIGDGSIAAGSVMTAPLFTETSAINIVQQRTNVVSYIKLAT